MSHALHYAIHCVYTKYMAHFSIIYAALKIACSSDWLTDTAHDPTTCTLPQDCMHACMPHQGGLHACLAFVHSWSSNHPQHTEDGLVLTTTTLQTVVYCHQATNKYKTLVKVLSLVTSIETQAGLQGR